MRLFIAGLLVICTHSATAATFYVSPTGSDSAAGTQAAPFKTISKAGAVSASGDIVNVLPGTYALAAFRTTVAGVQYLCVTRQTCKLQPANGTPQTAILWENDGGGVTIDGFEVDGRTPDGAASVRIALYASPTSTSPVTYQHNLIHHVYQRACNEGGAGITGDAWYSAGAVVHYLSNTVHDIGPVGGCNTVQGIYLATIGDARSNVIWKAAGWGITTWHDATQNTIADNTLVSNVSGGISVGNGECYRTCSPWTGSVKSNVVVGNNGGVVVYGAIASGQIFDANLVTGNTTDLSLGTQTATGTIATESNAAPAGYGCTYGGIANGFVISCLAE